MTNRCHHAASFRRPRPQWAAASPVVLCVLHLRPDTWRGTRSTADAERVLPLGSGGRGDTACGLGPSWALVARARDRPALGPPRPISWKEVEDDDLLDAYRLGDAARPGRIPRNAWYETHRPAGGAPKGLPRVHVAQVTRAKQPESQSGDFPRSAGSRFPCSCPAIRRSRARSSAVPRRWPSRSLAPGLLQLAPAFL